jgi:hypothetical protein
LSSKIKERELVALCSNRIRAVSLLPGETDFYDLGLYFASAFVAPLCERRAHVAIKYTRRIRLYDFDVSDCALCVHGEARANGTAISVRVTRKLRLDTR